MHSHIGEPMLFHKAIEGSYLRHIMIEDKNEGGQELLFGLNQAEDIDEQLITYACLNNTDQSKFGNVMKELASQKILKNDLQSA